MRLVAVGGVVVSLLLAGDAYAQDARMVPVTIDGERVRLEMRIYQPATAGPALSIPGADRGLRDIAAAMGAILTMPFVDPSRVVIAGQSRGGILSVAYAGRHPQQVKGVINFVGGWVGAGCRTASEINQALFTRGVRYPAESLWLYADEDIFYPLAHSRENFAAFRAAGGIGTFHEFPPGSGGHYLRARPDRWSSVVEAYLKRQGLPSEKP